MNTKIKELIELATSKEEFYPAGNDGHPEYRNYFDKEKFAKLIVQECINFGHDENGWKPDYMIKKHFGE